MNASNTLVPLYKVLISAYSSLAWIVPWLPQPVETAVKRLAPYKKYTCIKKTSLEAVKKFKAKSLDFVYLGANHEYSYAHVLGEITKWSKKVKKGGTISGYAYRLSKAGNNELQVVYAVNDYVREHKIKHLFILGRKQGVAGEKRDRYRSWFWVE